MKRLIITILFLSLSSFSYSMEVALLFKKNRQQEKVQKKIRQYFDQTLPKIKLSELKKKYCILPENVRKKLVCRMSSDLQLLHSIVLALPQEVQRYILNIMLFNMIPKQGEKQEDINRKVRAINCFYDGRSILENFEQCQKIIKVIGMDKPVAPLCLKKVKQQNNALQKINLFKSCSKIITEKEFNNLQTMHEDEKQYFKGYQVIVESPKSTFDRRAIQLCFFGSLISLICIIYKMNKEKSFFGLELVFLIKGCLLLGVSYCTMFVEKEKLRWL